MNQKRVLVEHLGNTNSVIKKTLQNTQRIKFTCFDVSGNCIVFGATSGGVYIFTRYPATFIKLIPSKHGSVVQVVISPNGKFVVLATSKGLIVVIEDYITENNVEYQVYCEHEGNHITALKWHLDGIYCGDDKGKISLISLSKAIFQPPTASLMRLNSPVVQIDAYSKFLLISTYTRTYLCDTEKEQYVQIGKKLRDGCFGGCFFARDNSSDVATATYASTSRGLFKNVKDDEKFLSNISENVRIFCTRPGGRMWEAKMDATVACTHQFKNSLKEKSIELIRLDDDVNSHLRIFKSANFESSTQDVFNFTKVFVLEKEFILTFNYKGFYIFDPISVKLVCWCNKFTKIRDVKVIKNFVYIWNENNEIHVVALYTLEKIILKALFRKQYYISSELCVHFLKDVSSLVKVSDKIHLVLILKEKLANLKAEDTLNQLSPLFKAIQEFSAKSLSGQKSTSTGIVVINKPYIDADALLEEISNDNPQRPEALQTLKEISANVTDKLTESTKNLKEKLQILEATVKNLTLNDENMLVVNKIEPNVNSINAVQYNEELQEVDAEEPPLVEKVIVPQVVEPVLELDSNLKIFCQQYEASKINSKIEIPKFKELLVSNGINDAVKLFTEFKQYMIAEKGVNENEIQLWCYKNYLWHISLLNVEDEIKDLAVKDVAVKYIVEAFRAINLSSECGCKCLFPLPSARCRLPHYYEIGCAILNKYMILKNEKKIIEAVCKDVPFMWKHVISKWKTNEDIDILLPLLIQFGDEELIRQFLNKFKYDTWDCAVQYLIKLKQYFCINCDNKFKKCDIISWTDFATLIVQSIGGPSTIKLLLRYASSIPSNELDSNFYKSCIFTTAVDNVNEGLKKEAINFMKVIQSNRDTASQFDDVMAQFLRGKCTIRLPTSNYSGINGVLELEKTDLKCSFCDLPFEPPLLCNDDTLKCNHLYHKICLKYNNNICKCCKEQE